MGLCNPRVYKFDRNIYFEKCVIWFSPNKEKYKYLHIREVNTYFKICKSVYLWKIANVRAEIHNHTLIRISIQKSV